MWSRIGRGRVRALGVALLMPHALLALAVRVLAASDSAELISAALLHELGASCHAPPPLQTLELAVVRTHTMTHCDTWIHCGPVHVAMRTAASHS